MKQKLANVQDSNNNSSNVNTTLLAYHQKLENYQKEVYKLIRTTTIKIQTKNVINLAVANESIIN